MDILFFVLSLVCAALEISAFGQLHDLMDKDNRPTEAGRSWHPWIKDAPPVLLVVWMVNSHWALTTLALVWVVARSMAASEKLRKQEAELAGLVAQFGNRPIIKMPGRSDRSKPVTIHSPSPLTSSQQTSTAALKSSPRRKYGTFNFGYTDSEGEYSFRRVAINKIGGGYAEGRDLDCGATRTFRVDRVVGDVVNEDSGEVFSSFNDVP